MLYEYTDSLDQANFCRSLAELGVPHFHHEVVYELIVKCLEENSSLPSPTAGGSASGGCGIESKGSASIEALLVLLKHLCDSVIVSQTQFENGVRRVYEDLAELEIDVPRAFVSMEALLARFDQQMNILPGELRRQLNSQ